MLPLPFRNFIPKLFRFNESESMTALISKAESHITEWRDDILNMKYILDPLRTKSQFLDELGYYLNAGITGFDTERDKRIKIYDAVARHKKRGLWNDDVKGRIQNITGIEPTLIKFDSTDGNAHWLLIADGTEPSNYWSILGVDGIDDNQGILLEGEGIEILFAGNIYIDLNITPPIDQNLITQIKAELVDDVLPDYMRIFLGNVNISGQFIVYINGVIE